MSLSFELTCPETKQKLWIGQGHHDANTHKPVMEALYSGEPVTMEKLRQFLTATLGKPLMLVVSDHTDFGAEWKDFGATRASNLTAKQCVAEMSTLWHLSKTATSDTRSGNRQHARYLWAAQEFSKAHPEFSPTAAYKLIDRMLARYPASNDKGAEDWANQVLDQQSVKQK